MKLGIVYHMPFWRDQQGVLWELEGSFARYVDSLAPYFDEISLCVPEMRNPPAAGSRIRAANVRLAPLPFFDGPAQFYPRLPRMAATIVRWASSVDVLHCRVPTPAAFLAYVAARAAGTPVFVLVVGDLRALRPSMTYRGAKKAIWATYTELEEWCIRRMIRHALTFANGAALTRKHDAPASPVIETKTTTIDAHDLAVRADTCAGPAIRLLAVSRIDPRKGLRCLPDAVARLGSSGYDVSLDIIGPVAGGAGAAEREAILADALRLGVVDRVRCVGALPLDQLLPRYRDYDLFVLPTLPGEGIPRVLLEAMAAGLPVITTRAGGIASLIAHERNGILLDESSAPAVSAAVARLVDSARLRQQVIRGGYETARAHTLEAQAARMMAVVSPWLATKLRDKPPNDGRGSQRSNAGGAGDVASGAAAS